MFPPLEGRVFTHIIWNSAWEIHLFSLIYVLIYHQCGLMGLYFIFQVTIQEYIVCCTIVLPLSIGSSFSWIHCPLTYAHYCVFFLSPSFNSGVSDSSCMFSSPALE